MNIVALQADHNTVAYEKEMWTFIRSQRGAPLLVYDGFLYRNERRINKKTYWLCIRYKSSRCNGRMILNGNTIVKETEHTHATDNRSNDVNLELKSLLDDDIEDWMRSPLGAAK